MHRRHRLPAGLPPEDLREPQEVVAKSHPDHRVLLNAVQTQFPVALRPTVTHQMLYRSCRSAADQREDRVPCSRECHRRAVDPKHAGLLKPQPQLELSVPAVRVARYEQLARAARQ